MYFIQSRSRGYVLVSLDSSFRRVRLLYSPFSDRRSIAFQEHVSTFLSLTLSTRTENSAGLTSFQGGFYNETHMLKSTGADIDCRQSGPCSIVAFNRSRINQKLVVRTFCKYTSHALFRSTLLFHITQVRTRCLQICPYSLAPIRSTCFFEARGFIYAFSTNDTWISVGFLK